jgi:hypothetical protein
MPLTPEEKKYAEHWWCHGGVVTNQNCALCGGPGTREALEVPLPDMRLVAFPCACCGHTHFLDAAHVFEHFTPRPVS